MSQSDQILTLLKDGNPVCVTEILEKMMIVDYRARLSGLKRRGYNLISEPCDGKCGRRHNSGVHRWQLVREQAKLW